MSLRFFGGLVIGLVIGFAIAFIVSAGLDQLQRASTPYTFPPTIYTTLTSPTTVRITETETITLEKTVQMQTTITSIATKTVTFQSTIQNISMLPTCRTSILIDESYFQAVKKLLEEANRSIYIVMYAMKYDPSEPSDPVNQLLSIAVEKRLQGVDVKIIVDDVTYNDYPDTVEFLKMSNISFRLDESKRITTHAKIVIVDNRTAVIGSHNWTESALQINHEVSIEITCQDVVKPLLLYFDELWAKGRQIG